MTVFSSFRHFSWATPLAPDHSSLSPTERSRVATREEHLAAAEAAADDLAKRGTTTPAYTAIALKGILHAQLAALTPASRKTTQEKK